MSVLLLRLKAPQQSWGVESRYQTRDSQLEPSKSGVIGLVAAAQGRDREADLTDLLNLNFGVRVDQPGKLMVDYQTAKGRDAKNSSLSWRHYRVDAAYMGAVSGPDDVIESIAEAIENPAFPLYLGRRSCPAPAGLLVRERFPGQDVEAALRDLDVAPWLASPWYRKKCPTKVYLPLARDAKPGEVGETVNDVPISFSPKQRKYATRTVVRPLPVLVDNTEHGRVERDPFFDTAKEG